MMAIGSLAYCQELIQNKQTKTLDVSFQDTDLRRVLTSLADAAGYNIVIPEDVTGKVTLKLKNASWEQVFSAVLWKHRLMKEVDGNVLIIKPLYAPAQLP